MPEIIWLQLCGHILTMSLVGTTPKNWRGAVLLCTQELATNDLGKTGLAAVFYCGSQQKFSNTCGHQLLDYIHFCFNLLELFISVWASELLLFCQLQLGKHEEQAMRGSQPTYPPVFAFSDARHCDSPSLQQPQVTTNQHTPAPNSTATLGTAEVRL